MNTMPSISRSEWLPADTGLDSAHRVCVVGDVHGMSSHLAALLAAFEASCADAPQSTLVLLGDLVDRGADSIGALDAAVGTADLGFTEVVPLMGNHEQMMRRTLSATDWNDAELWFMNGGRETARQLPCFPPGTMDASEFGKALEADLGEARTGFLERLRSHHEVGNLVLVHAGVDPGASLEDHFSQPWNELGGDHWCWIRDPFLTVRNPAPGRIVVHGHTPVMIDPGRSAGATEFDPHLVLDGRMNLDAGSYFTGQVAGAEFKEGSYRISIATG